MLNVSIVLYKHTVAEITPLINTLRQSTPVREIFLIDNSPMENKDFGQLDCVYIFNGKNLGYGAAHNIAIRRSLEQKTPYHLVINPDVEMKSDVLGVLIQYMEENPSVGQLMPKVLYPNGEIQYLCKLIPTPSDLFFRRFLPAAWTKSSNERFELKHSGYNRVMNVPYLSGCFMLLRTEALKNVGLFDERFFMYPEDIDLTRRINRYYKTIFYPNVSIFHHHKQGSYKNRKLLRIHLWNLIKYFHKWGWFFDQERKKVNENTLKALNLL